MYHVSLAVEILKDGVHYCKLHVDGAGRLTQYSLLGLKFRMPPAFLAGSVNPRGYKMHFLGLLASEEFGPTYVLNEQQGNRLLSLAHHAITDMNSGDKLLYCTKPFSIGALGIPSLQIGPIKTPALQTKPVQFWTSNSVVASLVDIVNKEGINLPKPTNGCYPGFDGPFLPKSLYEYNTTGH